MVLVTPENAPSYIRDAVMLSSRDMSHRQLCLVDIIDYSVPRTWTSFEGKAFCVTSPSV